MEGRDAPTALSSMICCALVLAADMVAGLGLRRAEVKSWRRKEILKIVENSWWKEERSGDVDLVGGGIYIIGEGDGGRLLIFDRCLMTRWERRAYSSVKGPESSDD